MEEITWLLFFFSWRKFWFLFSSVILLTCVDYSSQASKWFIWCVTHCTLSARKVFGNFVSFEMSITRKIKNMWSNLLSISLFLVYKGERGCTFPVSRDWSFFPGIPVFRERYYGISSSVGDRELPYNFLLFRYFNIKRWHFGTNCLENS